MELSHADSGMVKESGVESKGMTVKVRGRAAGGWPPEKEMLKGPHCCTREYAKNSKSAKTHRGAKTRKKNHGKERSMAKQIEGEARPGWMSQGGMCSSGRKKAKNGWVEKRYVQEEPAFSSVQY